MSGTAEDLPPDTALVIEECRGLVDGFAAAGRHLYLVGGIVRDLFHGAPLGDLDLDFTTDAPPSDIKRIVGPIAEAMWTQGERFGTIAAKVEGRLVEITTHRAEAYDPASRKPDVVFSEDVLVDLSRRDFTINAAALELTSAAPRLIDPFGGIEDLRTRRLRTPLTPVESFSDDPLRMLRAARFVARLGVVPVAELVEAIDAMTARLAVVSAERVRDELEKLLAVPDPGDGLRLLLDTGLSTVFLPELDAASASAVAGVRPDSVLRLAVLLSGAGEVAARRRLRALRSSRHVISRVAAIVASVGVVLGHDGTWSDPELRRLAHRAGDDLGDVVAVAAAASGASGLEAALADLGSREDLTDLGPPVDGQAVMAALGLAPGPDVGAAIDHVQQLRWDVGPLATEEAIERLRDWQAARDT